MYQTNHLESWVLQSTVLLYTEAKDDQKGDGNQGTEGSTQACTVDGLALTEAEQRPRLDWPMHTKTAAHSRSFGDLPYSQSTGNSDLHRTSAFHSPCTESRPLVHKQQKNMWRQTARSPSATRVFKLLPDNRP